MRQLILLFFILLSVLINAQNQNVAEVITALNNRNKALMKDSVERTNKIKVVQQQLNQCRMDSAAIQKQLNDRKSLNLQHYKDSLGKMNREHFVLLDSINKLNGNIKSIKADKQKKEVELKRLYSAIDVLSERYEKLSVDDLFDKHDKRELILYKELCARVNKKVTSNIEQALACFNAKEQLTIKYNSVTIELLQRQLPQNTKVGKQLYQVLQKYALVNQEAMSLWSKIHNEVCDKLIDNNDDFLQIQKKRQIWQRTQIYLNKYPNLSSDYPYIYEQIQSMLRQIWENANNFNKIKNPFE